MTHLDKMGCRLALSCTLLAKKKDKFWDMNPDIHNFYHP